MSIGERLKAARRKAGYSSARAAADAFGWKPSTYASHENGQTETPPIEAIEKYARAFRVTADELAFGAPKTQRADMVPVVVNVPVRGIAQAGVWREFEDFDFSEIDPIPVVLGSYPASEQFAWGIRGDSLNRLGIIEGDFVICVPYWIARTGPTDRDLVAVERREGPRIERTVKRLRINGHDFELHPESDNPRHKPIVVKSNTGLHDADGAEVEIVGLVIGKFAKL